MTRDESRKQEQSRGNAPCAGSDNMRHTADINQRFLFPGPSAAGSQESQQVTEALW